MNQSLLQKHLSYDPLTGLFVWREGRRVGQIAGTVTVWGYIQIKLQQRVYRAHRLAWLYVYGVMPDADVDHIDRNTKNNTISNLRLCSQTDNNANGIGRKKLRTVSGYKGVYRNGSCRTWVARIQVRGEHIYLGCYVTPEDAACAYDRAAVEHFGEFARTNASIGLIGGAPCLLS